MMYFRSVFLLWIAQCGLFNCALDAQTYFITTSAGRGPGGSLAVGGFAGDGGPAAASRLAGPRGVAVDTSGNVYLADTNNNRIRRVSLAGTINTVAGSPIQGSTGDGGLATQAALNAPEGIAVDSSGNLYIADTGNNRVRKVTASGIITTLAGGGITNAIAEGGPATAVALSGPRGVAVDSSGNVYIADTNGFRVFRVSPSGTMVTVTGNGVWGFSGDGGPAKAAQIGHPNGIAVDNSGNVYIAESSYFGCGRIRKVSANGIITTMVGPVGTCTGEGPSAPFDYPLAVAVDSSGSLFVAVIFGGSSGIYRVSPSGAVTAVVASSSQDFSGDGGPALTANLGFPSGVAVDSNGNVFVADPRNNRIRELYVVLPGCLYVIEPINQSFDANGGAGSVKVTVSASKCTWSVSNGILPWVTVTSSVVITGNGTVTYSVSPSDSLQARIVDLRVAGHNLSISQAGVASCQFGVTPDVVSVTAEGNHENGILVTASAKECSWTAKSSAIWIVPSTSGTGTGSLPFTVFYNTGLARSGTISVAGHNVTVKQDGTIRSSASIEYAANAASYARNVIAPGEFVAIFGSGIGPIEPLSASSLTKGLGGSRVFVNGIEAFLVYASSVQINAVVPFGIAGSVGVEVQVEFQGTRSNTVSLLLSDTIPGLFSVDSSGTGQGVIVNQDSTFNSTRNPALRGSVVSLFATGQGQTSPSGIDGVQPVGPGFPKPALAVSLTLGGIPVPAPNVLFSGMVYAGVLQINFRVPANVSPGPSAEILLKIGNNGSRSGVTMAVQ